MHVLLVTQMVTFGSVDQGPIYEADLWPFISETPECCPSYLSVGIRLFQDSPGRDIYQWGSVYFGFPGPIQMVMVCLLRDQ